MPARFLGQSPAVFPRLKESLASASPMIRLSPARVRAQSAKASPPPLRQSVVQLRVLSYPIVVPTKVAESLAVALEKITDVSTPLARTNLMKRRRFIKTTAGTAFALSAGSMTLLAEKSVKPLRILILGGTGFIGPYQVRYALSRRHKVTTFNRGKTHPGELPAEVEQLVGDRNGKLDALKNRQWDVVIDNPTTLPAWVRDAAQLLKGNVDRYIFISTISVYGEVKQGVDESAPLEKYEGPDPYKETLEAMKASGYKTYGQLKALSE